MADTKISALTELTTPASTDEYAINDGGVSKRITARNSLKQTLTQEIWIGAEAFISSVTAGAQISSRETSSNLVNYTYAGFDTAADESVWFTWTPPANWNAGTIDFTYHWTNLDGVTTDVVSFDLAGVALADNDALDTALGTAITVADTWIAQGDLHISAQSAAVTIAGTPAAGEQVHFRLLRDVSDDDLVGDADILGVVIEYSVTDMGTT